MVLRDAVFALFCALFLLLDLFQSEDPSSVWKGAEREEIGSKKCVDVGGLRHFLICFVVWGDDT